MTLNEVFHSRPCGEYVMGAVADAAIALLAERDEAWEKYTEQRDSTSTAAKSVEQEGRGKGLERHQAVVSESLSGGTPLSQPDGTTPPIPYWDWRRERDALQARVAELLAARANDAKQYQELTRSRAGWKDRVAELERELAASVRPAEFDAIAQAVTANVKQHFRPAPAPSDVDVEGIVEWLLARSATPGAHPSDVEKAIRHKLARFITPAPSAISDGELARELLTAWHASFEDDKAAVERAVERGMAEGAIKSGSLAEARRARTLLSGAKPVTVKLPTYNPFDDETPEGCAWSKAARSHRAALRSQGFAIEGEAGT